MDGNRAVAAVARADQPKFAAFLGNLERLLLVARRQALLLGNDPYLQEVNGLICGRIVFAVFRSGPSAPATQSLISPRRPREFPRALTVAELSGNPAVQFRFQDFTPYRTDIALDVRRLRRIGIVAIGRAFSADICVGGLRYMAP